MPIAQPDLFEDPVITSDHHKLRARLEQCGWQTRRQLCEHFGWSERYVRELAESLGADIVRGQAGFKLTAQITREELSLAAQAADAFLSQGKCMLRYAMALKRRIHAMIE